MLTHEDHPRSRGVYPAVWVSTMPTDGSSPLARGLRVDLPVLADVVRIIPARAGFTVQRRSLERAPGDHPRSRGVYVRASISNTQLGGSSPLARGLRGMIAAKAVPRGIIPARAGFTYDMKILSWNGTDHPRSRGVYLLAGTSSPAKGGSSPLARGLLVPLVVASLMLGIIPARAGFTPDRAPYPQPGRDHPRSRGVYAVPSLKPSACPGSSPLARGLPNFYVTMWQDSGIIPARAGFTIVMLTGSLSPTDHPRSRGVYTSAPGWWGGFMGSSPLARGLPFLSDTGLSEMRIIPARAGFTQ